MDDVLEHLLGPVEDDEAEDDSLTAENDEGALDPLDALGALDSPEDDSEETEEEDDPRDRLAALEAERDAIYAERQQLAQQNERYTNERQAEMLQQAQAAWQAQEQQVLVEASQAPDFQSALSHTVQFYRKQIHDITNAAQGLIGQLVSGQFIDQVTAQNGLTADDKALLAALPADRVPAIAQALAAKNRQTEERLQAIEAKVQQANRGRQSQRRAMTRADGLSGNRGGAPPPKYADGSTDQALAILNATRAIKQARSR